MNEDFWFPWFPARFRSATLSLTLEQECIYRRLIDYYMETREPLPENESALVRIAGISNDNNHLDALRIAIAYFTHKNGMYFHQFCDEQLDIQDKKSKRRTASAEKAAKKRWENKNKKSEENQKDTCDTHTKRNAIAMRGDATSTSTSTIIEDTNVSFVNIAFQAYNKMAKRNGLPQAQILSDKRKKAIFQRIKDSGGIDGWNIVLEKVEASDFLTGKKTDWKADLDFIITKSKFISIMEGKYENGNKKSKIDAINRELQDFLDEK